jgi:hypothetical protein
MPAGYTFPFTSCLHSLSSPSVPPSLLIHLPPNGGRPLPCSQRHMCSYLARRISGMWQLPSRALVCGPIPYDRWCTARPLGCQCFGLSLHILVVSIALSMDLVRRTPIWHKGAQSVVTVLLVSPLSYCMVRVRYGEDPPLLSPTVSI